MWEFIDRLRHLSHYRIIFRCFEDLYWQCIEEKFCYDESIGELVVFFIRRSLIRQLYLIKSARACLCSMSWNTTFENLISKGGRKINNINNIKTNLILAIHSFTGRKLRLTSHELKKRLRIFWICS